mmetsp:Transcript_24379/g.62884  ORF Transcript_24379/g.62884 Transcript_24379/m.62884 type:complete len:201 (+) Transcript_24379:71-673(+)
MADPRAKVIVVGPSKAGKTRLANQIADFESEPNLESYTPTAGVRILEFDREITHAAKRGGQHSVSLSVELWDTSGDKQYESCWPAILTGVVGAILVFDPENASGEKEAVRWYSAFLQKLNLSAGQVLVLAHHKAQPGEGGVNVDSFKQTTAPKALQQFTLVDTTLDSAAGVRTMRQAVDDYLTKVGAIALEKHEAELDNL